MRTPRDFGWGDPYALTSADMVRVNVAQYVPGHPERLVLVRSDDVGVVKSELVRRLVARGWAGPNANTWGYAGRLKRWAQTAGQVWGLAPMSSVSDHAWGTGVDFSSDLNPSTSGPIRRTDMPVGTAEVASQLGLDWGGLWSSPYDPMHFGVNVSTYELRITADLIRAARAAGITDQLEDVMALYATAAEFEAGIARATLAGAHAVLGAWLPRTVAALNGRANSYFPDAGMNDDDETALLAVGQQATALLEGILIKLHEGDGAPAGSDIRPVPRTDG